MGKITEKLRKLGLIVNGVEPTGETISETIDSIADDYTGGSGGTTVVANPTLAGTEDTLTGLQVGDTKYAVPQGGGTSSVFCDTDLKSLVGKHLSVDKLIALLKSKNIIEGSAFHILGGFINQDTEVGSGYGIYFMYGSDTELRILNEPSIYSLSYDTDYETTLLNAKTTIESTIIEILDYPAIYSNCIRNYENDSSVTTYAITLQEFLDLFVD